MIETNHLELLAPAGQWEVLTAVSKAGADAIYAGGKKFNMRGLRPEMNFSYEQIKSAVDYLHNNGKKLYITINNLYFENEIKELQDYLAFLADAGVDALIVQDLAVAEICKAMNINLPLHASVQMGIANLEAVKQLEERGFKRIILSKDVSLEEIKMIKQGSHIGIEFFAHGDLCISHTGKCYMSTFMASEPGNRGKCTKPCRWQYTLLEDNKVCMQGYLLAHNDLCLYPYLSAMAEAGVSSFKIEGRMRSAEYLAGIVQIYRRALDKIINNPAGSHAVDDEDYKQLYENRIRDFSSANLFKKTDLASIGVSGAREPFFVSTAFLGKPPLVAEDFRSENDIKSYLPNCNHAYESNNNTHRTEPPGSIQEITVRVGNLEAVQTLREMAVDNIIIQSVEMRQGHCGWNAKKINKAIELISGSGVHLLIESPPILSQQDLGDFKNVLKQIDQSGIRALIANDLGAVRLARDLNYRVRGGYGLNITNSKAAQFYLDQGLERITASQELHINNLLLLVQNIKELEVVVQGPLCGMISDYCIIKAANNDPEICSFFCTKSQYVLKDSCGQVYRLRTDKQCRSHIFYPHEICLLAKLPLLAKAGLKHIRIDAQYYDMETLQEVTSIYINAMKEIDSGQWEQAQNFERLISIFPQGLTTAPVF
jgi:putative protease